MYTFVVSVPVLFMLRSRSKQNISATFWTPQIKPYFKLANSVQANSPSFSPSFLSVSLNFVQPIQDLVDSSAVYLFEPHRVSEC